MPAFVAGQMGTAEAMNRLRNNEEYLFSLESYASPLQRHVRCWAESATDQIRATWYMRHWSKYFEARVEIRSVAGGTAAYKFQIHDGSSWVDLTSRSGVTTTTYDDTVDLTGGAFAALVKGWTYQVRIVVTNCNLTVRRLYTRGILPSAKGGYDWYTHSASFLNDTLAAASVTAELNGWINNLHYLLDQLAGPWAPVRQIEHPKVGVDGYPFKYDFQHRAGYIAFQGGGGVVDLTTGEGAVGPAIESPANTYNHFGTLSGTYYPSEVVIPGYDGNNTGTRYSENRYAASGSSAVGALTRGNWYTLGVGHRTNTGPVRVFVALLAEIGGAPDTSGWTVVPAFIGGESGADVVSLLAGTPFRKFHDNLAVLKTRIDNYPHALYEHQNWEPTDVNDAPTNYNAATAVHFSRRGDLVAWRGTGVNLLYSSRRIATAEEPAHKTIELGDSAGGGTGESLLDLNSIADLPYDGDYLLDGNLTWAFELLN